MKNFLVKLRTEANKAHPTPEIVLQPAGAGDPEARRVERDSSTRFCPSDVRKSKKRTNKALLH